MAPEEPSPKRRRLDLTEEIKVLVGKKKTRFTVAQCFLTKSSDFFIACCNGEWKEARTKTVTLPEANAEAFSVYVQWLYTDELVYTDKTNLPALSEDDKNKVANECLPFIVDLAVLGDSLGDLVFSNVVVDAAIDILHDTGYSFAPTTIAHMYKALPTSAPLRKVALHDYTGSSEDSLTTHMMENKDEYPSDFIFDMMVDQRKCAARGEPRQQSSPEKRCEYHEHNDKVPKCASGDQ